MSSVAQLTENLGAVDPVLPDHAVRKLEAAVPFQVGFPGDFIARCEVDPFVFGDVSARLDARR